MTRPHVVLATSSDASAWRDAFTRALPDVELHAWPDVPDDVDFALVWKPPPELFDRVRVRRAIFNLGAGVDALLDVPTLPSDVPVVRLEDAGMAMQMAEYVTLAVLRAYREQDAYAAQQRERTWRQRPRLRKQDFVVGILGLGVLGSTVAEALRTFDFPVHGWSRSPREVPGVDTFSGDDGLARVLASSRVLVVLLPLTPATRGLVDRRALARLPNGAHVVNIARGGLVVDDDLIDALDRGHVGSATLDVFDREPLPAGHPFWHHPKIVLTPHVSAVTLVDESAAQVATKLRAMLAGHDITGIVDTARGY